MSGKNQVVSSVTVADLVHACSLAYKTNRSNFTDYKQKYLGPYKFPSKSSYIAKTPSGCVYTVLEPKKTIDKKQPIIIAFKGTNNLDDLVADAQIATYGKAKNYQKDADNVIDEVIKNYRDRPIIVTGHSLGGSLANHAVARIVKNKKNENIDIRAVTFGAPGIDEETHEEIYKKNNAPRFITFENTHDPIAGVAGARPTDIVYKMSETRSANPMTPHYLKSYTVVNTTDSKIRDNRRLKALSNVVVSDDLETVHHALMTQELKRLKEKSKDDPKKWFMGVALKLNIQKETVSPIKPYDLFIQAMKMDDSRYRSPTSKKEMLVRHSNGNIKNMAEIKNYLSSEISRMEKDDHQYLKLAISKQGTLKLTLFKSLQEKLKKEPTHIDPKKLQTSLNAIQSMHRDENHQVYLKDSWIQKTLSAIYPGKDMFNTLMEHTRHPWFGPRLSGPKSANNIPQVNVINQKIANLAEIKKILADEVNRMELNDNNYTKSSTAQTLKLYLFELLKNRLDSSEIPLTPIELQGTLNTIFRIERSEKFPSVKLADMGLIEGELYPTELKMRDFSAQIASS